MTIFIGDSLTWLKKLPSESVNCIVTSPPYYGLRSYIDNDNPLKEYEMGLEETPEMYIDGMVTLFREARRVLRNDGTLWQNIGDSYWANRTENGNVWADGNLSKGYQARAGGKAHPVYKPKDMMFIPHRVAMALQADGWYIRNDIVWHKPSPMPESVTDRCTKSHEYVFLCAKSERYYFDADAIRENANSGTDMGILRSANAGTDDKVAWHSQSIKTRQDAGIDSRQAGNGTRNKRDVWTIVSEPFSGAHFATMPMTLAENCIRAGCPETVCAECGAPYVRCVEKGASLPVVERRNRDEIGSAHAKHKMNNPDTDNGFQPSCTCNGATRPGVVLDPFGGAGTTALAAVKLNRHYQLIELNPKYVGIAQQRIAAFNPMQTTQLGNGMKQRSLFEGIA